MHLHCRARTRWLLIETYFRQIHRLRWDTLPDRLCESFERWRNEISEPSVALAATATRPPYCPQTLYEDLKTGGVFDGSTFVKPTTKLSKRCATQHTSANQVKNFILVVCSNNVSRHFAITAILARVIYVGLLYYDIRCETRINLLMCHVEVWWLSRSTVSIRWKSKIVTDIDLQTQCIAMASDGLKSVAW